MPFKDADMRKFRDGMAPRVASSMHIVDQADAVVPIQEALASIGYTAPEGEYFSVKVYCPWHYEHADQLDKNCRIYERSHLFCFAMHGLMRSSQVVAKGKDLTLLQAAKLLLDERGLLQKKTYWDRWHELNTETPVKTGDLAYVVQALQLRLKRNPLYAKQEYKSDVREAWQLCLEKLDVLPNPTYDELSKWLTISEGVISRMLVAEE